MKTTRSPIAMAAAALVAFAGASASAQGVSSVTLYGIVDVGVEHLTNVAAGGGLSRMPSTTSMVPSRWGMRGSEDLGGGLKAIYTLEAGFAPDQGTPNQGGRGFGRQTWVGLSSDWGSLTLGRQNSMLFWSLLDSDVIGPAVFAMGSLDAYIPNSRADNMLAWRGNFGGLSLGAGYSFGRDAVNAGPSPAGTNCPGESGSDKQACRQWSLYAKYDAPAWGVALGYEQQNGRTPASSTDLVFGGLNSSSKRDERLHLGGYVKLAGVKIGGGLLRRDNDGDAVKPRSNLWYLGASYPVTQALVLEGQWLTLRYRGVSDYDSDMLVARAVYNLSKRTAVYTQVGHIRNDRLATVSVSGGAPGSNTAPGRSQTGINFGIRHSF
ncbi:porin [Delftia sp. PS-11]|uniref:porin n=1 Tax=Delftia sp. PS-11 TaxID=2767222 RepID=UPI002457C513|nr:porin [Delftia sp. PS-11]KAJ8746440.1 porin [Delftia sp. PS-11]